MSVEIGAIDTEDEHQQHLGIHPRRAHLGSFQTIHRRREGLLQLHICSSGVQVIRKHEQIEALAVPPGLGLNCAVTPGFHPGAVRMSPLGLSHKTSSDHKADGSLVEVGDGVVGSGLIGQSFTDLDGNPLMQYFQSRPSAAGAGYDPMSTAASNLGPEDIVDSTGRPSLLTTVCARSRQVGEREQVDGSRPFCTKDGVGAVLSVIGPRDTDGEVSHPVRVVASTSHARHNRS